MRTETSGVLFVVIDNHASEPIFDLDVESMTATSGAWRWQIDERVPVMNGYLQSVPSGDSRPIYMRLSDGYSDVDSAVRADYAVTFSFSDSGGRRWRRTNDDGPERLN